MAGYPYTNQVTDDNAKKAIIAAFDRISVLTAAQDALQTAFTALSTVTVVTNPTTGVVTPVPPSGGTGLGSFNTGDLVVADTPSTLIGLPDVPTGNVLLAGGSGVRPFYGKIGLTTHVSGTLPVGNGGTNSAAALSGSTIMISNGSGIVQGTAGTTTTVLHGNAGGAPTYGAVSLTADVSGDLPFANLVPATAISVLIGRGAAAGAGDFQEITLGANLTMTGTVLSATGGSGTPAGSDTQVQFNDATAFGGAASLVYNKTTALVGIGVAPSGAKLHIVNAASAANQFALLVNQQDIDQSIVEFQQSGTRIGRLTVTSATDAEFDLCDGGVTKIGLLAAGVSTFNGGAVRFGTLGSVNSRVQIYDNGTAMTSVLGVSQDDDAVNAITIENIAAGQVWNVYIANTDELIIRDITNARNPLIFYPTVTVFNEAGLDNDLRMEGDTNANLFFLDASTDRIGIGTASPASLLTVNGLINTKNYTVATLPAGTRGDIAYVTDALAPAFLAVVVGGGAVVAPVFYNGANWVGF